MITRRTGLFETNSSSVHAIVIDKHSYIGAACDILGRTAVYDDNNLFGWDEHCFESTWYKLQYLIACINGYRGDDSGETPEIVRKFEGLMCELGIEAIKYGTGCVDHSYETRSFVEYVLQDLNTLKRYLFSDKSYVVTGNDNDDECSVYKIIEQEKKNPDVIVFVKGN